MFQKGQSGNPGGRSKAAVEITEIARAHGEKALNVFIGILNDPDAPLQLKMLAAKEILDRGFGKPRQIVERNTTTPVTAYKWEMEGQRLPTLPNGTEGQDHG